MKQRVKILTLIILSLIIAGAFIAGSAFYSVLPLKTRGVTEKADFAGIYVPENENSGLFFDTTGYITGEGVYIFLPCTADLSRLVFYSTDDDGNYLERFEHDFSEEAAEIQGVKIYALKSSLPSVNISIAPSSPSLSEVEGSKNHSVNTRGTFELITDDGSTVTEAMEMRGRGNTSWTEDKKSYQVELKKPKDLLSMGRAEKWVLLANSCDHSLLRNEVFLSVAREMGLEFTPSLEQTDLFINGEYRGTYSLCSRVETGKARVDIDENDFLYRIGVDRDNFSFFLYDDESKKGAEEYAPIYGELRDCRDSDRIGRSSVFIKKVVEELYDPSSELKDIDLRSLTRYYWLQEFSKTTDPTLRSVYMYWRTGENRMYMGPPWDYDRTAGIIEMPFREEDYIWPDGWTAREQDYYRTLFKNPVFTEAVNKTYKDDDLYGIFMSETDKLPERIDRIKESAEMNFIRWNVLYGEEDNKVSYAYGDTSYESHVRWLSDWLRMRAEWINDQTAGNTASSDNLQ